MGAKIQNVKDGLSLRNAIENTSEILAGKLLLPLSRHGHGERREITWSNFSDRWLSYQKTKIEDKVEDRVGNQPQQEEEARPHRRK